MVSFQKNGRGNTYIVTHVIEFTQKAHGALIEKILGGKHVVKGKNMISLLGFKMKEKRNSRLPNDRKTNNLNFGCIASFQDLISAFNDALILCLIAAR